MPFVLLIKLQTLYSLWREQSRKMKCTSLKLSVVYFRDRSAREGNMELQRQYQIQALVQYQALNK